jgi:hypothetical protein
VAIDFRLEVVIDDVEFIRRDKLEEYDTFLRPRAHFYIERVRDSVFVGGG